MWSSSDLGGDASLLLLGEEGVELDLRSFPACERTSARRGDPTQENALRSDRGFAALTRLCFFQASVAKLEPKVSERDDAFGTRTYSTSSQPSTRSRFSILSKSLS